MLFLATKSSFITFGYGCFVSPLKADYMVNNQ